MKHFNLLAPLCLLFCASFVQSGTNHAPITLLNPSFERSTTNTNLLPNWDITSDTALIPNPFDYPDLVASHGKTALVISSTPDRACGSVQQQLEQPLQSGKSYAFAVDCIAMPEYKGNARLQIWAYDTENNTSELLSESAIILNPKWVTYPFVLKPKLEYDAIGFAISGGSHCTGPNATLPWEGASIAVDRASRLMPVSDGVRVVELGGLEYAE